MEARSLAALHHASTSASVTARASPAAMQESNAADSFTGHAPTSASVTARGLPAASAGPTSTQSNPALSHPPRPLAFGGQPLRALAGLPATQSCLAGARHRSSCTRAPLYPASCQPRAPRRRPPAPCAASASPLLAAAGSSSSCPSGPSSPSDPSSSSSDSGPSSSESAPNASSSLSVLCRQGPAGGGEGQPRLAAKQPAAGTGAAQGGPRPAASDPQRRPHGAQRAETAPTRAIPRCGH